MAVSTNEISKLQREVKRLRAENARLKRRVAKNGGRNKRIARRNTTKWISMVGVGKDIWRTVDVDAYLNAERNSWN